MEFHLDSLTDHFSVSKAAIVIIDAFRNNPFAQSTFRSVQGYSRGLSSGVMNLEVKSSGWVCVVYSTSKGDVIQTGKQLGRLVSAIKEI